MFSSFTFRFPVPSNPFSAPPLDAVASQNPPQPQPPGGLRRSPSIQPINRKRARWEPSASSSQHNLAVTQRDTAVGYLDTPSKYRDLAESTSSEDFNMVNTHETEPSDLPAEPPAKRRRGIAGSIVSTAVSAALIGSAVGLTVYRLWRDRGKDTTQSIAPPPPYQEASWPDSSKSNEPSVVVTPATPLSHSRGRKSRNQHVNSPGSTLARRRRRVRPHGSAGFSPQPHQQAFFPNSQPEFTFGAPSVSAGDEDGDEQMDALSSRLTYLIEQGKKALRTEVVVGSERQEDLVDDGEGEWIDDEVEASTSQSRQRSASRRRSNRSGANTPRETQFGFSSNPMAIPNSAQRSQYSHAPPSASFTPASPFINGFSASPSPSTSFREDPSNWSSDIMRESMERARARAQERATGSSGQFGR